MFMIATIQSTVSGTPAQLGSAWMPRNGKVKRLTQTPKMVGTDAATSWPASFWNQRRPRKSSITPTVTATAAPSRMPRFSRPTCRNASDGTSSPRKSATPPSRGTGCTFTRRPPGASTTPSRRATSPTAGVRMTTSANAASAPQTTSRFEESVWRMLCCDPPESRSSVTANIWGAYFARSRDSPAAET